MYTHTHTTVRLCVCVMDLHPPQLNPLPPPHINILAHLLLCLFFSLQAWLRTFGYLPRASGQMSTMASTRVHHAAISRMQRFYGLEVTGELDAATVA